MNLIIPTKFIKKINEPACELYDEIIARKWRGDDDPVEFKAKDLRPGEVEKLMALAKPLSDKGDKVARNLWNKLQSYLNTTGNKSAKIKSLESLETALYDYIDKLQNHWLFCEHDGVMLPYFVNHIEYCPYEEDCPAHVNLKMVALSRGQVTQQSFTWHSTDLRAGQTVAELLADKGCLEPDTNLLTAYTASLEKYGAVCHLTGEQFSATGTGVSIGDHGWREGTSSFEKDGKPTKVVMDDDSDESESRDRDSSGVYSNAFWKSKHDKEEKAENVALPTHPFVKVFGLEEHEFSVVHVSNLAPYQWDDKVEQKLVLSVEAKELVEILIASSQDQMDDIIAGKTGGTIILATGVPGTGKTLTAEVFSEHVHRPLYFVQCSQLGTDEEALEANLKLTLKRAQRWKAILLIDEVDVYVRERGEDIQQNAIVGVFLRVLEYYRGILFMTSNRGTAIDDAIVSRATARIRYVTPDDESKARIWGVLSKQYDLQLASKEIEHLIRDFPNATGRNIKNLLKLGKRYATARKEKPGPVHIRKVAKFIDMPELEEEGTK